LLEVKFDYTKAQATVIHPYVTVIYPYETAFYYNLLLKNKYNVDQKKVSEFFEINNVTEGIFKIYQQLYNIRFVKDEHSSTWNKEVTAYSVFDNVTGKCIGYFYLDMHPRPGKYTHFACFPLARSKRFADGSRQLITSALVCNFPRGENGKPSLLPHNQVETFFHEFGHLIHTILSETELSVYGGTDVVWDFVEAPSQIMENWAWQKDVLKLFAKHYETGAVIPDSLLENMIDARRLNSGVANMFQVYLGTLDFTLHNGAPPESADDILSKSKALYEELMPYPWVDGIHLPGSFSHLNLYGSQYYGVPLVEGIFSRHVLRIRKDRRIEPGDRKALQGTGSFKRRCR
jgi:thimet oligopeptidase